MPDSEILLRALRQEALRLLSRREHSRAELAKKLLLRAASLSQSANTEEKFDVETVQLSIETILDGLAEKHWQSDQRFAQQRVTHRGQRYGNQRLAHELAQSGVAEDEIAHALDSATDELTRCQQVWSKKFGTVATDRQGLAKQMRFLQYRGFSGETIRRVLKSAPLDTSETLHHND